MTDETAAPTPHPEEAVVLAAEAIRDANEERAGVPEHLRPWDEVVVWESEARAALAAAMPLCQAEELNTWIASARASAAGLEASGHDEAATALKILARQMRARYAALRSSVAAQTDKEGS